MMTENRSGFAEEALDDAFELDIRVSLATSLDEDGHPSTLTEVAGCNSIQPCTSEC